CNCNQRSILDIIWSCLVTIFLCTWVAVHPDVPARDEKNWKILGRRFYAMCWIIMFPELALAQAVRQVWAARHLSENGWTMKHAHFLRMGGFYAEEHGRILNLQDILIYLNLEKISFRNVTEADIQDKSKADGLSKIVLVTQSLWFVIQCIGRRAKGLDLAPLEVTTLAITACTFMLSIIWWNKQFNVRQPIRLDIKDAIPLETATPNEGYENEIYLDREGSADDEVQVGAEGGSEFEESQYTIFFESEFSTEHCHDATQTHRTLGKFGIPVAGAIIFGLVHCISWNSPFPSVNERTLWRISAVVVSSAMFFVVCGYRLTYQCHAETYLGTMLLCSSAVLYLLARIYLLVEAAIAFRALSSSALESFSWFDFIAH
ncbi:hypothetical protein BDQ17DRAFT_1174087, partial [Cyathus striatus]